jgi:hypothetical protein
MKLSKEEIIWNAFQDELEKDAFWAAAALKGLRYGASKALRWAKTMKHHTGLEKSILKSKGKGSQIRAATSKWQHVNPVNAAKGAIRNVHAWGRRTKQVFKADAHGYKNFTSKLTGKETKRTYNPMQKGWKMFGAKTEAERAGLQGLKDYGAAAIKPLGSQGPSGLVGYYGLSQTSKAGRKNQGASIADAAAWTVAPAATGLGYAAHTIGSIGKNVIKNKRAQRKLVKSTAPKVGDGNININNNGIH